MLKENIFSDITRATMSLLAMARDVAFNTISENCLYIISEILDSDMDLSTIEKIRIRNNCLKTPKDLKVLIPELEELYPNLYDVNLYVYKAKRTYTVVEIQYYPRSTHSPDYQKLTELQETMLHCKVPLPNYHADHSDKFDINWQSGTLNHRWRMFWWRRKKRK